MAKFSAEPITSLKSLHAKARSEITRRLVALETTTAWRAAPGTLRFDFDCMSAVMIGPRSRVAVFHHNGEHVSALTFSRVDGRPKDAMVYRVHDDDRAVTVTCYGTKLQALASTTFGASRKAVLDFACGLRMPRLTVLPNVDILLDRSEVVSLLKISKL